MNARTSNVTSLNFTQNKKGRVILFVLFLLFSVNMFGQNKPTPALNVVPFSKTIAFDSDLDFMNWFMGAKQTQVVPDDTSVISTSTSKKKQLLSLGITPNKVLYRTFVKKVISQESAIV